MKMKRAKHRMSQHELAKLANVSRYNISLAESEHRELTKEELVSIKQVFAEKEASNVTDKKK